MATSPQSTISGLVSRAIPSAATDGTSSDRPARFGRYGEQYMNSIWPTLHLLADEGSLVVANMLPGATALQLGISASFSAVAAAFTLANTAAVGGKRLYPTFLKLGQSVAPTSGIDLRYAIVLDSISRVPTTVSGIGAPGTPATATAYRPTPVCVNLDENPSIVGQAYFPLSVAAGAAPTVPAATGIARTIVGNGYLKNSIPVVKDQYTLQFGAAEMAGTFQSAAALSKIVEYAPPIVVGPQQLMLIYLWSASNITAGNAWDDVQLAWVER